MRDVEASVAVPGDVGVGVGRSCGRSASSTHGPIGLPIQRVLSGTDSPLITRDTGPTVACRPIVAAGRITLFGPRVAPARSDDPVHAQHPVVEQVGLHHAAPVDGGAVAQLDQVGLGQPVGLAPHAAADPWRRASAARG